MDTHTPHQPPQDDSDNLSHPVTSGDTESIALKRIFAGMPMAIVFILIFAAIGSYILFKSFAATAGLTKIWQSTADWSTNTTLNSVTVADNAVSLTASRSASNAVSGTPITGASYIVGVANKCLDDQHNMLTNGNTVWLYTCNNTTAQQWVAHNGSIELSNTGYCLDVKWAGKASQTPVWLYTCNGTVAQQWKINSTTGTVINPSSGLCLDDRYSGTADGNPIWIYTCNGTDAQKWTFKTISATPAPTPPTTTTYAPSGSITLNFDADAGTSATAAVTWNASTAKATTPAGTSVQYQYASSTDNKTWSAWASDITKLAHSRYLRVQATLSTTDTHTTPTLTSLSVSYTAPSATPAPAAPTVHLSANPTSIAAGKTTVLTWSSTNSTSCNASGGWSGSKATNGTLTTGALSATTAFTLTCSGTGGSIAATVSITVTSTTTASSSPSGQSMPGTIAGYKQVCGEDFTTNAATGSWGTSDAGKVVYKSGCSWTEYPDGWAATYTNGQPGYEPSQVLSVHDGTLDYNLKPINGHAQGANPSPLLANNSPYQTYGKYIVRLKTDHVAGYHDAWLLWPTNDNDYQSSESDFPEMDLSDNTVNAYAHYGGNGNQAAFSKTIDTTQWHTYEQDWTPTSRSYYIDGQLIGTTTQALFAKPERFQLQTEPASTAAGGAGHELVDWVAIYTPN